MILLIGVLNMNERDSLLDPLQGFTPFSRATLKRNPIQL